MHCLCVDPAQVEKVWPLVLHLIRNAMERGGGDFEIVQADVLTGEKLLWLVADERAIWAAVVTGLHIEKDRKYLCIWACGGIEADRWLALKSDIEKFAKDEGCEFVRVYGRKGWGRLLSDYTLTQIVLEKAM